MKNKLILICLVLFNADVLAGSGLALTWQNSSGKWWACGPVQCTWGSSDSEEEALGYVAHDKHRPIYQHRRNGKCWVYSVTNVKSYEHSAQYVKNKSKC